MGAQIAALLAGFGIEVDLLDLPDAAGRDRRAEAAREKLAALRPSPLFDREDLGRIRPGNVEDHASRLGDCDWVIEAVFEDLEVKQRLWSALAPHVRADAVASTNTSSIPIHSVAAVLPADLRRRFLGAHFFNPPRYLRLLELIPTQVTAPAVTTAMQRFGSETLGKGCVVAHDVPGFVGNRIGLYVLAETLRAMQDLGLGPDEVDAVTGPPLGRPRSATFRTLDLIGLDVYVDICDKLQATVPEPWEQAAFAVPDFVRTMVERGWLGEKSGQGFYKREEIDGRREILVLDPETLEYRSQRKLDAPSLAAIRKVEGSGARIAALAQADDVAGQLAWRVLSRLFAFAAAKIPEVADEINSIDSAMRWGFAWELGPFETWEAMGIAETAKRMEEEGLPVPSWVTTLARQDKTFYRHTAEGTEQATPAASYIHVSGSERALSLPWLRAQAQPIAANDGGTLWDIGDGIAFLDVHGPKQTIDADVLDMLHIAAEQVPAAFKGLALSSHVQPNICVGANLAFILQAAQEQQWDAIKSFIHKLQYSLLALKRMPAPFVTALYGRALGGGLELGLSAHRMVAARESYMGLVETAVGLVPAGGGCKELLLRMLAAASKEKMDSRVRGNDGNQASGNDGNGAHGNGGNRTHGDDVHSSSADSLATQDHSAEFRHSRESSPPAGAQSPSALSEAVRQAFETIRAGSVSQHAPDALDIGYLRARDVIEPNPDHVVYRAKAAALDLNQTGDVSAAAPATIPVQGASGRAALLASVERSVQAGKASDHDLKIAQHLARILTGGGAQTGTEQDESHFLDLEREAFVSLCGESKTQDRIAHILKTGKPLRN
jgi:3-hydroxyacyl-CoA dehydrogenase